MKMYLVGPNDESYLSKRRTWDLDQVLKIVDDGDVIQLEEDYSPYYEEDINKIIIGKNITIIGHIRKSKDGDLYTNTLNKILIKENTNVTLKNICIVDDREKENCLNIKNNSSLIAENILIENHSSNGENYPIVYLAENSEANFNNLTLRPSSKLDGKNIVYAINSSLTISNSILNTGVKGVNASLSLESTTINNSYSSPLYIDKQSIAHLNAVELNSDKYLVLIKDSELTVSNSTLNTKVKGDNSSLNLEDTFINSTSSNALVASNQSIVHLKLVRLDGSKTTKDNTYSCVKILNSKGSFESVTIAQANYHAAFDLRNSNFTIHDSLIDSLNSISSTVNINNTRIIESFIAKDNSKIKLTLLTIDGKYNGTINLYANRNSSIQGDTINFGKESSPTIRLETNVDFDVEKINLSSYDSNEEAFQVDQDGNLIILDKEVEIDYFGKKRPSERLNELIGSHNIKEEVKDFVNFEKIRNDRKKDGLKNSISSFHSLFRGNPGTGKTTVARILGELFYENKLISKEVFIEVSKSDLVGNHIVETTTKTRKILESALGGVLFINEAHTLSMGISKDCGLEAINEIVSFMENHRNDTIVIFAGDTDDMNRFLETNDGLKSLIANIFDFPDFTIDELIQIGLIDIHKQDYQVNDEAYRRLIYNNYEQAYDQSNSIWIKDLNQRILRKAATRMVNNKDSDLTTILDEDLDSLMI